jgi:hypothetical protein
MLRRRDERVQGTANDSVRENILLSVPAFLSCAKGERAHQPWLKTVCQKLKSAGVLIERTLELGKKELVRGILVEQFVHGNHCVSRCHSSD